MKIFLKTIFILFLAFFNVIPMAQADLFISPLRVTFDGRDRSALITLVNRSEETNTYRINWGDKHFNSETSRYETIDELGTAGGGVSEIIRYSPRQITLKPGEKQKIRLAIRKPADLENGEYRSHLVFEKVPNIPAQTAATTPGSTMKLYVNLSFAIPVFVRHNISMDDVMVEMTNLSIGKSDDRENIPVLNLTASKQGEQSAYGKILVHNMNTDNTPGSVVGILNNAAVLKENAYRNFIVDLDEGPITSNRLYVVYKGESEFEGVVWDEQIINLN